jgi:uncharacterized phage protein gp47/JayE
MTTIPKISDLYSSILADLQTEYGVSIPLFGKIFLRALAMVQAGKLKLYYLAIGMLQKNIFVDTADPEASGGTLERFGRIKLGRNPFPATAGQYTLTVTGTTGSTIQASTTFKTNDDSSSPGKLFILDLAHVLAAPSDTITVRALESGSGSKLVNGDGLTATAPIAGVSKNAVVLAEAVAPVDAESIEDYRRKTLEAFRLEPTGGSGSDYRLWADDAVGCKQVYPYAKTGAANEINLFIEANVADSTDGFGTPSGPLISAVQDVVELDPDTTKPINQRGRRPLGVFLIHYLPVTIRVVDINITGFAGITPAIKTLILNAVTLEINKIRPFVASADVLANKNDILDLNKIISIVLGAKPGSIFGAVTLKIDTVSVSTYTFINGDIPHLNTITYV